MSMTSITQKLFNVMDSHRNRSTLHRLSLASAIAASHDGPSPLGFGRLLGQNPAHHVLVDLDTERMGHLLCDARTAEFRIVALHLQDHGDPLFRRSFGSGTA